MWSWRGNSKVPQNVNKSKSVIPKRKIIHLFCYEHIWFFLYSFLPFNVLTILNKQVNCLLWVCWTWRGMGYIGKKSIYLEQNFPNVAWIQSSKNHGPLGKEVGGGYNGSLVFTKKYIEKNHLIFFSQKPINYKTLNLFGSIFRLGQFNFVQIMISRGRGGPQWGSSFYRGIYIETNGGLILTKKYREKNL